MRSWRTARLGLLAALTLSATTVASPTNAGANQGSDLDPALPIVFVHGFSGSGAQYETQALRWASNDYPNVVTAIDRTSTTPAVIYPILDEFFDDLMASTGDSQLYVLGHSAGTAVMFGYLNSSPERAARVAKYIGIDGLSSPTCPGGVPCLGIWARGSDARVLGDDNVRFPDQGHTESVGSPESFAAQYEFLTGEEPRTTDVVAARHGRVEVSGRVLNFPANTGVDGATLQLWKVWEKNGKRFGRRPVATAAIGADGNFGPFRVSPDRRYELTVSREFEGETYHQHFYYEPWTRDNHLLRLNLAPLDSPLAEAIERGPHAIASIVRQREWWGDNPVDPTDVDDLFASTRVPGPGDEDPVDIVNGATAPYTASTIALITFDIGVDQTTDVSELFSLGPFLSGIDLYMPGAADPPRGTVRFEHHQRGGDEPQVINTPNWSSQARHSMTVTYRDW
jgi:pimeloyl-ACP methyl ester carboxylesterase